MRLSCFLSASFIILLQKKPLFVSQRETLARFTPPPPWTIPMEAWALTSRAASMRPSRPPPLRDPPHSCRPKPRGTLELWASLASQVIHRWLWPEVVLGGGASGRRCAGTGCGVCVWREMRAGSSISMISLGCLFAAFIGFMASAASKIACISTPTRISRSAICKPVSNPLKFFKSLFLILYFARVSHGYYNYD